MTYLSLTNTGLLLRSKQDSNLKSHPECACCCYLRRHWVGCVIMRTQHLLRLSSDPEMGNTTNAQAGQNGGPYTAFNSNWINTWNLQHDSRGQDGLHRSSASITPDSEIFEAMVLKTGAKTGHRPRWASERVLEDCSERVFSQANLFRCMMKNDRWKTGHPPVWPHTPHDTLTMDGY